MDELDQQFRYENQLPCRQSKVKEDKCVKKRKTNAELIKELRCQVDIKHRIQVDALGLYLEGVKVPLRRDARKVLIDIACVDWKTVSQISDETGLTLTQIRNVLYNPLFRGVYMIRKLMGNRVEFMKGKK